MMKLRNSELLPTTIWIPADLIMVQIFRVWCSAWGSNAGPVLSSMGLCCLKPSELAKMFRGVAFRLLGFKGETSTQNLCPQISPELGASDTLTAIPKINKIHVVHKPESFLPTPANANIKGREPHNPPHDGGGTQPPYICQPKSAATQSTAWNKGTLAWTLTLHPIATFPNTIASTITSTCTITILASRLRV